MIRLRIIGQVGAEVMTFLVAGTITLAGERALDARSAAPSAASARPGPTLGSRYDVADARRDLDA